MKTALLLGMGGLGCPAALALSEERPSLRLVLVDPDRVDRSNLPRQILFRDGDVGELKAEVAARRLPNALARAVRFDAATAKALLRDADVVLDGTDHPETRFFANDECIRRGIPLVHGAALGWMGQVLTIVPSGPCLRCLFEGPPADPDTCARAGVLAPLCGVVGATMARAALDVLDGCAQTGVLQRFDARRGTARPFRFARDERCPACIQEPPTRTKETPPCPSP
jgi:molybdopterin/thiamine biosynthesis adenylyltransferase